MNGFYWPLSAAQNRTVTERVSKRLAERFKENYEAWLDDPLVLRRLSGRELLAFYRMQGPEWWMELAATYPERARYHARVWMALRHKYADELTVTS